jgi:NTE family protein
LATAVTDIHDHHRSLLNQHLHQFLGDLDPDALALLHERFEWIEVVGGETLIEQGAPGDAMYISVSGRLRAYAYIEDDSGQPLPVREMGRGQVFGEMSLYTDEPRSATVVAIRDSLLVRLDKAHFSDLLASSHQLSMALTRQIIQRLQTERNINPMPLPVTITLVPVTAGIDRLDFADKLAAQLRQQGTVSIIDSTKVREDLGTEYADSVSADDTDLNRRTAIYLDNIESTSDYVLLVADDSPTNWTQRCCRHGDELLLLAYSREKPVLHITETEYLARQQRQTEAAELLVLLHPADTPCPVGTAAWLKRRAVSGHVYIRPDLERDMARLARIETRTATGLVLAGGGARGFAHLGIFKALKERGTEIDFVGGTSMGAVMAALIAADQPLDRTLDICRTSFQQNPTGDFNWLPLISLISGRRLAGIIVKAFRELLGHNADLEDLWKNYYCVATNYSRAQEQVMRHGSLSRALRASTAIPGALPPILHDGDMLCDGATLNNFPVDIMRTARGVGTVIGVDLTFSAPRRLAFEEVPGTWTLLRDRLRKRHKRQYKLPSLASYLMNVSILYSMSRREEAKKQTDLYFNPPLKRVGLLDWRRFDQTVKQGYEHGVDVLDKQT